MILVAGLVVAGLAGIAAAFYFSMHPGGSRVRAARTGRAGDSRLPASKGRSSQPPPGRSDRSASPARPARSAADASPARPARSAGDTSPIQPARSAGHARSGSGRAVDRTGSSTVIDFTGPQRILDDAEPVVTGRRARHSDHRHDTSGEPGSGRRATARRVRAAATDDVAEASRSRRRVAWRKGSDVDEELWPAEAFGGVSDEQFWDDMAADKPLATTARTAQPDNAARRRPPGAGPLPDLYPADDRSRGDSKRRAAEGLGTHPQPRLRADDRSAIQPVQAGRQPSATPSAATQPYKSATQPLPTATQPVRPAHQPAESRGRSRPVASSDEDPLTSPAYSLRSKGSVNGRSYPPAGGGHLDGAPSFRQLDRPPHDANEHGRTDASRTDASRTDASRTDASRTDASRTDPARSNGYRSDPLRPDPLRPDPFRSSNGYGGIAAYPYPLRPHSEPTRSMTSVHVERYGYGNPAGSWIQATPASDPRRANGGWSQGRIGGNGASLGQWGSRPVYPPAGGYRAAYDPRGYDRRLSPP
jgi:hypothetical protein